MPVQTMDMAILLSQELSPNQGLTPEGFLICTNVPVARTGVQYYLGSELGIQEKWNDRIPVYRVETEVFKPETLQSLESKPLTDDHPRQGVTVQNNAMYSRGHGRNARRDGNLVVADLVVTDPVLIQKIQNKTQYQISLGYNCQYEPYKDGYLQTNICINHIAVVEAGRAGPKVSIQDSVKSKGVRKPMNRKQALTAMFAAFVKDATPEEIAAVIPFITDGEPAETKEASLISKLFNLKIADAKMRDEDEPEKKDKEEKEKEDKKTEDRLRRIEDAVASLIGKKVADKKAKDADEEEVEKMLDEDPLMDEDPDKEEKETEDADEDEPEKEKEKKEAQDAAFKQLVSLIKPAVAKLPEKQRDLIKDTLVQIKRTGGIGGGYEKIQKIVQASKATQDSSVSDLSQIGRNTAMKRNPHYAKK